MDKKKNDMVQLKRQNREPTSMKVSTQKYITQGLLYLQPSNSKDNLLIKLQSKTELQLKRKSSN